jgi:hypothetical protein
VLVYLQQVYELWVPMLEFLEAYLKMGITTLSLLASCKFLRESIYTIVLVRPLQVFANLLLVHGHAQVT